jgi:small-conductance mechanosensitive channel
LFSATAQEFLQSIIFVFVKHPFDVGDRVGIYGNTGALGRGDDYFVKEIALLYTEFKKMEGHVVQAPNSYLNTLFILNQRRSGGLAEAVPVTIKFGTTLDQIDQLRQRLLDFVKDEKREYQPNILTELREVKEAHAITLNVVFFYKSNWQNELLRLQRRNKFICALMVCMQDLGIEGPRMRFPGQKESFPVYLQNLPHTATPGVGHNGNPDNPNGILHNEHQDPPFVAPPAQGEPGAGPPPNRYGSILRNNGGTRPRGESLAAMTRRVDFSLGMKDIASGDMTGDVYEERESQSRTKAAISKVTSPSRSSNDHPRQSRETGRSTSVAGSSGQYSRLQRVSTDGTQAAERSSHRNRFFGRGPRSHQDDIMETGMANIPESEYNSSKERLDPRSGLVSSMAMRMGLEGDGDSSIVPPTTSHSHQHFHASKRSQTDTFEMSHLR